MSPNYTLLQGEAELPISLDWKNYLTEGTQVLENSSEIYINKWCDNNKADSSNLEFEQCLEHKTDKRQ